MTEAEFKKQLAALVVIARIDGSPTARRAATTWASKSVTRNWHNTTQRKDYIVACRRWLESRPLKGWWTI